MIEERIDGVLNVGFSYCRSRLKIYAKTQGFRTAMQEGLIYMRVFFIVHHQLWPLELAHLLAAWEASVKTWALRLNMKVPQRLRFAWKNVTISRIVCAYARIFDSVFLCGVAYIGYMVAPFFIYEYRNLSLCCKSLVSLQLDEAVRVSFRQNSQEIFSLCFHPFYRIISDRFLFLHDSANWSFFPVHDDTRLP